MSRLAYSVALLIAVLVSACGASVPASGGAAPLGSSAVPLGASAGALTPSAAPSISQDQVIADAAKAHLALVTKYNKLFENLYKAYNNKVTLKAHREYCSKMAVVTHSQLLALKKVVYPDDTLADIKAMIKAIAAAEANLKTCAIAPNIAAWNRAWSLVEKAQDRAHEAANLVRLDLGLPSVPG